MRRIWVRGICVLAMGCLVASVPLSAGVHYKARTYTEGGQRAEAGDMTVESWVDGLNAKVLFQESGNPTMKQGTFLITTDGGVTVMLVNTEEETYAEFDLQQMMAAADEMMQGSGGMFEIKITDPKVEVLEQGGGGSLLGHSTTHYKVHTSFQMDMKIMGMKRSQAHDQVQEMWTTTAFTDQAMGIWLRRDPPDMGNSGFGDLIKAHTSKIQGFPLKTVSNDTVTTKKGKQTTRRTIMEVTEIEKLAIDGKMFVIPDHFTETQIIPEMQAGEGGEEPTNPLSGVFGRKKKKKDKN